MANRLAAGDTMGRHAVVRSNRFSKLTGTVKTGAHAVTMPASENSEQQAFALGDFHRACPVGRAGAAVIFWKQVAIAIRSDGRIGATAATTLGKISLQPLM
jgi:hypothetical protein